MSRKGNSPDNDMMESFFAFFSLRCFIVMRRRLGHNQLEQAIVDYIDYYNNERIKVKLKHTKM
ncbi:MAG: IS3 family transposase [Coprobacillus cateniformis]